MKRPWLLSVAVALATIAVGVAAVLVLLALAPAHDSSGDAAGAAAAKHGTEKQSSTKSGSSESSTTTTTTLAPAAPTTPTTPVGPPNADPTVTPADPATDPVVVPEFDQTDPPDPADAYVPEPFPPGVSSTITSCRWSPDNGGHLEASGAMTNSAGEDEDWILSAVWLWRNGNQDEDFNEQDTTIHAEVGQTVPWQLTIDAPTQPPNLSCALEIY